MTLTKALEDRVDRVHREAMRDAARAAFDAWPREIDVVEPSTLKEVRVEIGFAVQLLNKYVDGALKMRAVCEATQDFALPALDLAALLGREVARADTAARWLARLRKRECELERELEKGGPA